MPCGQKRCAHVCLSWRGKVEAPWTHTERRHLRAELRAGSLWAGGVQRPRGMLPLSSLVRLQMGRQNVCLGISQKFRRFFPLCLVACSWIVLFLLIICWVAAVPSPRLRTGHLWKGAAASLTAQYSRKRAGLMWELGSGLQFQLCH